MTHFAHEDVANEDDDVPHDGGVEGGDGDEGMRETLKNFCEGVYEDGPSEDI